MNTKEKETANHFANFPYILYKYENRTDMYGMKGDIYLRIVATVLY